MKLFKFFVLTIITLFILAALLVETAPGKRFLGSLVVKALNRSGVTLEIGEISGRFPQEIEITDLSLPGLSVQKLHLEISFLPLLGGELRIEELRADQVEISPTAGTTEKKMPLALSIRHYHLEHIKFDDLPLFSIEGSAFMRRKGRTMKAKGALMRYDLPEARLAYDVSQNRLGGLEGFFKIDSPTLSVFEPWLKKDGIEGKIHLAVHLRGNLKAFSGKFDGLFVGEGEDPLFAQNWQFKGRINQKAESPLQLPKVTLISEGLQIQGSLWLDNSYAFQKAIFESRIKTDRFTPHVQGHLSVDGVVEASAFGLNTKASWKSEQLNFNAVSLAKPEGWITGTYQNRTFNGHLDAQADFAKAKWTLGTDIGANPKELRLENLAIEADPLSLQGDLTLTKAPSPKKAEASCYWKAPAIPLINGALLLGQIRFQRANLSLLGHQLAGVAEGAVSFYAEDGEQKIDADLSGRALAYGPLSAESAHIVTGEQVLFVANFEHVKWKKLIFDTASVELTPAQFTLDADGKLLQLYATGDWSRDGLTVRTADGRFLQHNTHLLRPMQIAWGKEQFALDRLYLAMGQGRLDGNLNIQNQTIDTQFTADAMPLELLSLNPMNSTVQGTFSASGKLHKESENTDADWQWKIEDGFLENEPQILFWENEPPVPLTLAGQMEGSLHKEQLKLRTNLQLRDKPFLALDLITPLSLDASFEPTFPVGTSKGNIHVHGKLEDLFDFVDLGMHQIAGQIDCDLTFSQGAVKGGCMIQDGYYQNYVTGTELHHITAILEGTPLGIELKSLTAKNANEYEVLSGTGTIHLSLRDRFPYHIEASFDHLDIVQIDLVTAHAKGNIVIDGDLRSALASGSAQIIRSDVTIPSHIPRSFPDLQVIYKHRPLTPPTDDAQKLPFPLHLDLKITAPDAVFIGGRGLTSEWNGDFTIGGTYTEPSVQGNLQLIEGEFSFAGKRFKLTNGSLSMQGDQYLLPLIDITGTITEQSVVISTRLKGPINRPQLTFQSLPPLPLSAILSHLLFGKDLSDVTGLQALQLAGTVAAVAGEGPDILEITRKSLGVDRLQIVMTPTKSGEGYEGKETIALEVGKILTPGVILTIKQSASYSNPDIGIEADLLHGFVLEVQTQQQPEQGKFSLKWNVNY